MFALLVAASAVSADCSPGAIALELIDLVNDNSLDVSTKCTRLIQAEACIVGMDEGTVKTSLQNQLSVAMAPMSGACDQISPIRRSGPEPPVISTQGANLAFSAEEITLTRRSVETVSLFEMYEQVQNYQSEMQAATQLATDAMSTQAAQMEEMYRLTVAATMNPITSTVQGMATNVDSFSTRLSTLEDATASAGPYGPCLPGVEFLAGEDDNGDPVCQYLSWIAPECPPGHFSPPPTRDRDLTCRPYGECDEDHWRSFDGNKTHDIECTEYTTEADCEAEDLYSIKSPTPTSDRECGDAPGLVRENPGSSCAHIKDACSGCENGKYWVRKPHGGIEEVYCDQELYGGGWMLVGHGGGHNPTSGWHHDSHATHLAPNLVSTNTWHYSSGWINQWNYDVIRGSMPNVPGRIREGLGDASVFWRGKATGHCTFHWNQGYSHHCWRSYNGWGSEPTLRNYPNSGGCQGHSHGCHRGMGDWPCGGWNGGGEWTVNHCHGGYTGWYISGTRGEPRSGHTCQVWSGHSHGVNQCDLNMYVRVKV